MKEVFEKIIETLLEKKDASEKDMELSDVLSDASFYGGMHDAYEKSIEIVKQTAAEYNNGWIPCSERLPEEGGYYLVTYHEWSNGDYLPKFDDTYVRRLHYQKSERFTGWNHPRCCDDKAENDTNREVIAWQPLPQPFQKGE